MSNLSIAPAGGSQAASTVAGESANQVHTVPPDTRVQDTRRQVVVLQTLWSKVCRLSDAAEKRRERVRFMSLTAGRPVNSANDLSDAELELCIQALLRETHQAHRNEGRHDNVLAFPNRNGISQEQRWKIRQLEAYLGWSDNPTRLAGLLRAKFKASGGELQHVSHGQAWRLIEMLFAIAARAEVQRDRDPGYKVPSAELRAVRASLKERLHSWRPTGGQRPAASDR